MKLLITTLFLFLSFSVYSQNMSNPHVRKHVKLQNEVSFEVRSKENKAFTLSNAKYARKQKKRIERQEQKRKKRKQRLDSFNNKP